MTAAAPRWYVLKTRARAEHIAQLNLQRQGYRVYLPLFHKNRRQRGEWRQVTEPLFAGYLFVQLEIGVQNFSPIRSTKGVLNLVRFSELPEPMPDGAVETLITNLESSAETPRPLFQPGARLQIVAGAFAGWEGICQAETPDERVLVLLNILGKQRPLAFPRNLAVPA